MGQLSLSQPMLSLFSHLEPPSFDGTAAFGGDIELRRARGRGWRLSREGENEQRDEKRGVSKSETVFFFFFFFFIVGSEPAVVYKRKKLKTKMLPRKPCSSCRGNLALASLLALALLLFFCSTAAQGRPHGRRREEQQQQWSDAPHALAAVDSAPPSPSAPPTLALLLAPAPAPSRVAAPAGGGLSLQEGGAKGGAAAAAAAPSSSAISSTDAGDDNEEEEEEASSDDGAGDGTEQEEEEDPRTEADVTAEVASAYRAPSAAAEPPAVPGQPKKVKFLARGAAKEIAQGDVDPSSLSGDKGSFVFYGRYCGPGWTDKQGRPGIDAVDEACHAHDTCYGAAREANPPAHKVRRAAAECACDRKLVAALKDFRKSKQQQAAASKAAKRAASDMEKLFDVKCPLAVAGAVLRPPSPESAPGKW